MLGRKEFLSTIGLAPIAALFKKTEKKAPPVFPEPVDHRSWNTEASYTFTDTYSSGSGKISFTITYPDGTVQMVEES